MMQAGDTVQAKTPAALAAILCCRDEVQDGVESLKPGQYLMDKFCMEVGGDSVWSPARQDGRREP